ncbi:hypothetical protein [Nocardia sp. NPDC003345]
MVVPEAFARPVWKRTGDRRFPVAALVDGRWWVLRMNPFPDHSLWTLFIDGVARYDVDQAPPNWGRPSAVTAPLDAKTADAVLAPVRHLGTYGSEVGRPCDDPFCCG